MTAMAVLCWFAYRGNLSLDGTWASWAAKLVTAIIFTVLALGEFVADKLPNTPNRTALGPLLVRVVFGGLIGAMLPAISLDQLDPGNLRDRIPLIGRLEWASQQHVLGDRLRRQLRVDAG